MDETLELTNDTWHCPKCQYPVGPQFGACWNCGTARDGTRDPEFKHADEIVFNEEDTHDELEAKRPFQYSLRTLMIITTVIAVFLALGAPIILRAREAARRATCFSNLRELVLAMHNFESG